MSSARATGAKASATNAMPNIFAFKLIKMLRNNLYPLAAPVGSPFENEDEDDSTRSPSEPLIFSADG
jgi:hypothetical protein